MIVLFTTSDRWISRFIRWFTRSEASHVAMLVWIDSVAVVFHADVGGVQFTPFARFLRDNRIVYKAVVKSDRRLLFDAVACIGDRYDYLGLVAKLFHVTFRSPSRQVCSEFVARALPIFKDFDPERVSPADLLYYVKSIQPEHSEAA